MDTQYLAVPQAGHSYPISLGETLLQAHAPSMAAPSHDATQPSLCCLRYNFRPRTSTSHPGKMLVTDTVTVQLPNCTAGDFEGPLEPSRDGLDCVAIFDGTCFRIEVLDATIKAKYDVHASYQSSIIMCRM